MCAEPTKNEETIYHEAVSKPPKERKAYIEAACGNDTELFARIEALLKAREVEDSFLEVPALDPDVTLDSSPISEGPGTVIGRYKLLEKIGEGGMAVVYMAEQDKPLRRRVALKIIKLGMDTKQVIARFEAERQALAMMDHPNIAKVLDAGATETGRPYFVMELVRGVSITEYCDTNRLNTQQRLELFISVCNAVHHAHQKGIIHRDIKPSNVMVTLHDGEPVPKIIDFGIAKATNQRLTEQTVFTRYAEMIGTPEYMSPEQAEMSGLDVDTRTDIYSLGIVLYELLTGVLPFDPSELRSASLGEIRRIIREEEPPRPSTRLSTLGEEAKKIAESRRSDVATLARRLHSELEWIPLKAMRKERTRRYRSAYEFADDIRNYLSGVPLIAGPESATYRLGKLLRKYRVRVVTVTAVAAALLIGFVISTSLYVRVRQAQNAVARLERAVEADRKLSTAQRLQAEGRYSAALSEIEQYLSRKDAELKARLLYAQLLLDLDRFDKATAELEKLVMGAPEIAGAAHYLLAKIYIGRDPNKAKEHQQAGESLLPQTAEGYCLRGVTASTPADTVRWLSNALELDPSHYPSRKARALAYYAMKDYTRMAYDVEAIIVKRPKDSFGYTLRAINRREMGKFDEAIKDHNYAIEICDVQAELAELHDQRRETFVHMGNYKAALRDAHRSAELEPEEFSYKFHVFTALVSLGEYEAASDQYMQIVSRDQQQESQFSFRLVRHVFDLLGAGRSFELPEKIVAEAPFFAMREAADTYRRLDGKATRLVSSVFGQSSWSPDGKQLAYGRTDQYVWRSKPSTTDAPAIYGSSGIETLDLETRKTRLIISSGKDPAWSPDGKYIAFVREPYRIRDYKEEVWLIATAGGEPRRLALGGWPIWASDSRRLFFHSREQNVLCCVRVDDPNAEPEKIMPCPGLFPGISPDEKYVAYAVGSELRIVDISTGSVIVTWIAPSPEAGMIVRWSPDGKEILLAGFHYSNLGLWSFDVEHKKAWQLFEAPAMSANLPSDRSKISVQLRTPYGELWLAELDPQIPIYEAVTPSLTQGEFMRHRYGQYLQSIKNGTLSLATLGNFKASIRAIAMNLYRNAEYEDAVWTLTAVDELRHALGEESYPSDVAFMAMSLHQLGRDREAEAALERLRRLFDNGKHSGQEKYLYAAEKALAGENSKVYSAWEHIETGRLREAAQLVEDLRASPREEDIDTATRVRELTQALARAFYHHGRTLQHQGGTYGDTIADYEAAVHLDPNLARAFCELAWLQAACPTAELRNSAEAIENATKACELTKWKDHRYVGMLAAVYAELGDFAAAVQWQKEAIGLLTEDEKPQWQADYESRLELYQSNKRYDKSNLWSFSAGRMVAWWKFDEAEGSKVVDASGNDRHGTLQGNPQWVTGITGGALAFDGADDYVDCGTDPSLNVTGEVTVSAWIKLAATGIDQKIAGNDDNTVGGYKIGVFTNDKVEFEIKTATNSPATNRNVAGGTVLTEGVWCHVAGVYSQGNYVKTYVNGELDRELTTKAILGASLGPFRIGCEPYNPGRYSFNGVIDDVRIYNYALNKGQIKELSAGGGPGKG